MSDSLFELELKNLSECEAMLISNDPMEILDKENHDDTEWEMLASEPQVSNIDRQNLDVLGNDEQLQDLTMELKHVIKRETKVVQQKSQKSSGIILNPTPISYYVSSKHNYNIPLSSEEKKKKRGKATLVGTNNTSFKLSNTAIAFAIDLEKEKLQNSENQNQNGCRYTLLERLEGWRIDRKLRADGQTFDMFFEHLQSKCKCRSVTEVINFILHGAFANKPPNRNKDALLEENLLVPPGFEEPGKYSFTLTDP